MGEGIGPKQRGRQPTYSWQYVEGITAMDENPVSNLSWYDAVAFCEWLSQKEQATYRLPTEAEWEYVARAGLGMNVVGSPEWLDSVKTQANIADASAKRAYEPLNLTGTTTDWDDASAAVSPIGKFPANSLGLQDLIGNVSEFCSDRFDAEYYHNSPLENPLGPESGNLRVVRGASWQSGLAECRPGLRSFIAPNQTMMQVGFRVVQELPEPQPAGTTAPTETAPRREARIAEWALSLGGKVRVTFGPQPTNEILKVTDLPKRDYKVFSISLAETGVSDIGLLRLKGLAALQELDLSGNPITDPGLEVLAPFKTLTKLNLAGTHVTGDGLAQLLGCKKLADLDLSRCPVTDEKLDVVKGFVSLVALRLNGTSVSDAGLQALKPLVSLNELYLADTRVTGSGLNNLKRKDNLDPKKQLLVLDLSLTPIKDSNMELISNFPALRHLRLNWSAISDIGVEKFKQNYRLYELSLRGTEVSDHNEEMIGKARNIKLLDIRETDWTSSVVEGLKRTIKPPEAKIHWSNGDMNARCASYCLSVGGQVTIISDEGQAPKTITDAKDLPESAYYITSVQLSHLPVGDGWLWMVPKLSKLKELNLNGTRIDDAGLELLAKSQKIESLSLDGTLITESGLEHIAKMKQLKSLSVRDTRIPEAKVGNLRQQMVSTTVQ